MLSALMHRMAVVLWNAGMGSDKAAFHEEEKWLLSPLPSDKMLPVVFLELTWNPVSGSEESQSSAESASSWPRSACHWMWK